MGVLTVLGVSAFVGHILTAYTMKDYRLTPFMAVTCFIMVVLGVTS